MERIYKLNEIIRIKLTNIIKDYNIILISLLIPMLCITVYIAYKNNISSNYQQDRVYLGIDSNEEFIIEALNELNEELQFKKYIVTPIILKEVGIIKENVYTYDEIHKLFNQFMIKEAITLDLVILFDQDINIYNFTNVNTDLLELELKKLYKEKDMEYNNHLYDMEYNLTKNSDGELTYKDNKLIILVFTILAISAFSSSRTSYKEFFEMDIKNNEIGIRLYATSRYYYKISFINIMTIVGFHSILNIILISYTFNLLELFNIHNMIIAGLLSILITVFGVTFAGVLYICLQVNQYLKWIILNLIYCIFAVLSGVPSPLHIYQFIKNYEYINYFNPISLFSQTLYYYLWDYNGSKFIFLSLWIGLMNLILIVCFIFLWYRRSYEHRRNIF